MAYIMPERSDTDADKREPGVCMMRFEPLEGGLFSPPTLAQFERNRDVGNKSQGQPSACWTGGMVVSRCADSRLVICWIL